MDTPTELRLDEYGNADPGEFIDATEAAASQDRWTWIVDADGKRVAAIVPVDVAEAHDAMVERVLATPVGKPKVRFPDVTVCLSVNHNGNTGTIMATVGEAMEAAGCDPLDIRNFREAVFACASYDAVLQLVIKTVNVE